MTDVFLVEKFLLAILKAVPLLRRGLSNVRLLLDVL